MDNSSLPRYVSVAAKYRRATLVALCMAVLATQVDTTVVNLAAHPIGEYFSASVDALQWVLDSYNLTMQCCYSQAACWPTFMVDDSCS